MGLPPRCPGKDPGGPSDGVGEAVDGPELRAVEEGLGDEGEVVVLL